MEHKNFIVKTHNGEYITGDYWSDIGNYGRWIKIPELSRRRDSAHMFESEEDYFDFCAGFDMDMPRIESSLCDVDMIEI